MMKQILINALLVGAALLPAYAAFAACPQDDKPASPRSLPTDALPPFGMLDDNGLLVPVPSPAAMAAAAVSEPAEPPAPAAAPGPSLELATQGARAAVEACAKQGVAIAVAVIDSQGKPRAMLMAPGSIGSVFVAMRKAVAALTFRMPTSELGAKLQKDKALLARMTPVMFISGGGLPIWRGNELIGAIGSSGAHGAGPIGQLDEVCARAGLESIQGRLPASAAASEDFTGHVAFNVGSDSGRVENIAVTVGDGGTGPYKAILSGDATLPTHTIYRPRDLKPFGRANRLPLVAFANGGCRDSSAEFRNLLSEVASHGYVVVAIGPAGTAAVAGSEEHVGTTKASQLLDAVDWATRETARPESIFFQKIDATKVAVVGQSCGGMQALAVSGDPRVSTSIILNSSSAIARRPGAAGADIQGLMAALNKASQRYMPYGPQNSPNMNQDVPAPAGPLAALHAPIAYLAGGPSDLAYEGAKRDFNAIMKFPVVFLNRDVGHYPGTYREPNGGAFAIAVTAWLQWQLRGEANAKAMFVGPQCGLCRDSKWTVATKNLP
jgi:uncharacterized protein GlcG (DUF336 family)/dienelactone hydrolase